MNYRFSIWIPSRIQVQDLGVCSRDQFFDWLWAKFGSEGLEGIHEGTMLSEAAAEKGLETDSWLLDSAQAPQSRDWIGGQDIAEATLYFTNQEQATQSFDFLQQFKELKFSEVEEVPNEDWNAQWKASFLNLQEGLAIPPFWKIFPPWKEDQEISLSEGERVLKINPGAGFGTGTHETTQLCLRWIGTWFQGVSTKQVGEKISSQAGQPLLGLDFGSGSGILAVAMAKLGMQVDAVEVDPLAIDNARENSVLNQVTDRIEYSMEIPQGKKTYDLVVANILRPILLEYSSVLVEKMSKKGSLILSGLVQSDVPEVQQRFSELLPQAKCEVIHDGDWFSIFFRN